MSAKARAVEGSACGEAHRTVSKRPPYREHVQRKDIYVNNNSHFMAQLTKAQKLLEKE